MDDLDSMAEATIDFINSELDDAIPTNAELVRFVAEYSKAGWRFLSLKPITKGIKQND